MGLVAAIVNKVTMTLANRSSESKILYLRKNGCKIGGVSLEL